MLPTTRRSSLPTVSGRSRRCIRRIGTSPGAAPGGTRTPLTRCPRPRTRADLRKDVLELQAYRQEKRRSGVTLIPANAPRPAHILGVIAVRRQAAACPRPALRIPSHFAPAALQPALAAYPGRVRPPINSSAPTVMARLQLPRRRLHCGRRAQLKSVLRARSVRPVRAAVRRGRP